MSGPLRNILHSRSRRQRSLDGVVQGVHYNRHRHGAHYASPSGTGDVAGRVGTPSSQNPKEYDPIRSEYPSVLGYDTPDPWDAIDLEHPSPRLRLEPPERTTEPLPSYQRTIAFAQRVFELLQEVRDLRAAGEPIPAELAALYERATGSAPLSESMDTSPSITATSADPELNELAFAMIGMLPGAMGDDSGPAMLVPEPETMPPEISAEPLKMNPVEMAEATMPAAEPSMFLEAPMMDLHDPIGEPQAMTLDALVQQMMPEPAPPPEEPDPYMLMQQQFNQQMQMMDPFNMMGPMG